MNKTVCFYILGCLLLVSPFVMADEPEYDVTAEFGPKLDKVSFHERFIFTKTTGTDWYQSTLEQRKEFLENYHENVVAERQRKKESIERDLDKKKAMAEAKQLKVELELEKKNRRIQEQQDVESALKDQKDREKQKHDILQQQIKDMRNLERKGDN